MDERLISTETDDGYLLEGAQFTPDGGGRDRLPIVWMHGYTGRFYEPHAVAIGRRLSEHGHVFITGNNRGHDVGAYIFNVRSGEGLLAGAAWEDFSQCIYDYSAWISFACGPGFPGVVLVGHSLGAVKAVYYLAEKKDPRVKALVNASGPVRMAQRLKESPERIARAERLVAEGRGQELLPPDERGRINSARSLLIRVQLDLDVYGLETSNSPVSRIACPILFIAGTEEAEVIRASDLPLLQRNSRTSDTLLVHGADHVYRSHEVEVADNIAQWVQRLSIDSRVAPT
jgi:pimeloyl-ACP methyl ester carboxylesterase